MERTTAFSGWEAGTIVTDKMYQDPSSSASDPAGAASFSRKDREDAARLLGLIVG
jgi:hypothetical protein